VVLVERAPVVGGMAASFEVAGVRVDHGSHRLHPACDPAVLAELRSLLGDELQWRRRRGRIAVAGRWVAFPLRAAELARRLPPGLALRLCGDALAAPLRHPAADTYAEVVRAGPGPTVAAHVYFPYARKLWGCEPAELAGEQARRRISARSPTALVARALRGSRAAGGWFWYPARGFGRIPEALAEAADAAGARLRVGTEATAVAAGPGGVRVHLAGGEVVEGAALWSTLPLPALARLAGAPPAVQEAAAHLTHRSLVLAYLVVSRRQWTPYDAHYLPGPETPVSRVSEPRNYRDGPDPPDRTVICAEIPCAVGDPVWAADGEELAGLVREGLLRMGLPDPAPVGVAVRRLAAAYPVYRVGYAAHLRVVETWLAALPRVRSFGRLGLFAHDNTHHALAEARACVATADDDRAWAAARAGFARHVVED
jgi:protoporphyrinogen oxidase